MNKIIVRSLLELDWLILATFPCITKECKSSDGSLPFFSESMESAWVLAKALKMAVVPVDLDRSKPDDFVWMAGFVSDYEIYIDKYGTIDGHLEHYAIADTAPLAICLSALRSKDVEVEICDSEPIAMVEVKSSPSSEPLQPIVSYKPEDIPTSFRGAIATVEDLLVQRDVARSNKDWTEADRIRVEIESRGYRVIDLKNGSKVVRV